MAASTANLPHNSQAHQVTGVCVTMLILVTLVVAARFWIRWSLVKDRFRADDWCILVAWAMAAAFDLDPINQVHFGLGQHIYDLPPDNQFAKSLELYYFGELLYFICVGVTKIAILFLYLRFATSKRLRSIMWGFMAFLTLSTVAFALACIFQCTPIHKAWDLTGKVQGECIKVNSFFYANAGVDITQDVLIYILPMKMLYNLQLPKRQKCALIMVFAVGGFVVITGIVRLWYLKGAQNSKDPSYDNVGGAVWSSIECNTGVICASLPHFKPLFDRFFPGLMGRRRNVTGENPSGPGSSGAGKYIKQTSQQDTEIELECPQGGWSDAYAGDRDKNITSKIQATSTFYGGNNSDERLQTMDNNGIYKSTQIVFSHSTAA